MDPCTSTKEENTTASSSSNNEIQAGCSSLWDVSKGICTPVDESDICMEKHHKREEFFHLGRKTSKSQDTSVEGKSCRWCPILMLKNNMPGDSIIRCSVILPLCWVKIFWTAFTLNGAHSIGLRERIGLHLKWGCLVFLWIFMNAMHMHIQWLWRKL